jgi:PIN domain nuclease of toxin-antitoxin system
VELALLDTHVLLWALLSPERLSDSAHDLIERPDTTLLVSSASAWEIAIKHALGRLAGAEAIVAGLPRHLERLGATPLAIDVEHALVAGALPPHHRDPFDRMLVAQARSEGVPLVSNDALLTRYEVQILW